MLHLLLWAFPASLNHLAYRGGGARPGWGLPRGGKESGSAVVFGGVPLGQRMGRGQGVVEGSSPGLTEAPCLPQIGRLLLGF